MYVTGMATRRVANADPPTPIPDTKVSENTLYTIARLNERKREWENRRKREREKIGERERESEGDRGIERVWRREGEIGSQNKIVI